MCFTPLLISALSSLIGSTRSKGMAKKGRQEIAEELAALLSGPALPIPANQVSAEDSDLEEYESSDEN